jgi:hypothetical protein
MVVVEPTPEPKATRRYRPRASWLSVVPTLLIPWIVYNAVAATGVELNHELFAITLPSGVPWAFTVSDAVLLLSLMLLFFEILKSTRTGGNSVADHALSMIVFVLYLIWFLVVPTAATSLFFLITIISLIDVVAGFSVTIRAARRDYTVGGGEN